MLPLVLACAGNGTYQTPYRLELSDPLVISALRLLGENWQRFSVGLNDALREVGRRCRERAPIREQRAHSLTHARTKQVTPGDVEQQALRRVQSYLGLINDGLPEYCPMVTLGLTHAYPERSEMSRLAVLLLPRDVPPDPDGSVPYYLPHSARVLRFDSAHLGRGGEYLLVPLTACRKLAPPATNPWCVRCLQ